MRIRLLLFASYRDMAGGTAEFDFDVRDGSDAGGAVAELRSRDARFTALPPRPVVAVNREYASLDTVLQNGDELALLPPVAGG